MLLYTPCVLCVAVLGAEVPVSSVRGPRYLDVPQGMCGVVWCGVVWYGVVCWWCAWCSAVWCRVS
jgi:hypothetical protein